MTFLGALADKVSDPGFLGLLCVLAIVFGLQWFPWERERRLRAWFRLWRMQRRRNRILWSGGAYEVSKQMKQRLRVQ